MPAKLPFDLLEDPAALAELQGWDEEVYRDFLACQRGELDEAGFRAKYAVTAAILNLDMTGFTEAAMRPGGELASLLRIFDVQKVCAPVLRAHGARRARCFADDITAVFDDPHAALDAALEIHRRIRAFNESPLASANPAQCCIGLGYGTLFRLGPDLAMGDEMNRASKLGEDTARGYETLLTEQFHQAVQGRKDCVFERRVDEELPFPFYTAVSRG